MKRVVFDFKALFYNRVHITISLNITVTGEYFKRRNVILAFTKHKRALEKNKYKIDVYDLHDTIYIEQKKKTKEHLNVEIK